MAIQLGDASGNLNILDSTSKGILVQNPKVVAQAGYTAGAAIRDAGTVTGSPTNVPCDVSTERRLQVGEITPLFSERFNSPNGLSIAAWKSFTSTMTLGSTSNYGYITLNSNAATNADAYCTITSTRNFPLYRGGSVRAVIRAQLTAAPQLNSLAWIGIGNVQSGETGGDISYTNVPNEGAFFYWNGTTFEAWVGFQQGGTTTNLPPIVNTAAIASPPSTNAWHDFVIEASNEEVLFWIDGIL